MTASFLTNLTQLSIVLFLLDLLSFERFVSYSVLILISVIAELKYLVLGLGIRLMKESPKPTT